MPADIIDINEFKAKRAARGDLPTDAKELTAYELYRELLMFSYQELDAIIARFKRTGKWNTEANKHFYAARDAMSKACAAVSGVKIDGATKGQQKQTEVGHGNIPVHFADIGHPTVNFLDGRDPAGSDGKRRDDGGGFDGPRAV